MSTEIFVDLVKRNVRVKSRAVEMTAIAIYHYDQKGFRHISQGEMPWVLVLHPRLSDVNLAQRITLDCYRSLSTVQCIITLGLNMPYGYWQLSKKKKKKKKPPKETKASNQSVKMA